MLRKARRVPANWQHPKDQTGKFIPLLDGADFEREVSNWDAEAAKWASGEFPDEASIENRKLSFDEWAGNRPEAKHYMPIWPVDERTHYMMYELSTEGTPISPAFESPEALARWLADTKANAYAGITLDYDRWLRAIIGEDGKSVS